MPATPDHSPPDPLDHQGYVWRVARQYERQGRLRGLEIEDLVGAGQLGLLEACRLFDPARNTKFTTFADDYIRESIRTAIGESVFPVTLKEWVYWIVHSELRSGELRPASPGERRTINLARNAYESYRYSGLDLDLFAEDPVDSAANETEFNEVVQPALDRLPGREREIIRRRYGLDGREPQTFEAIGEAIGLSRERVRQLEIKAMAALRAELVDE